MVAQLKYRIQQNPLGRAIRQLLNEEMSGHLGPFMYVNDKDDRRWKMAHSSEAYYMGRDDKASFDMAMAEIDCVVDTVFDLGPGGQLCVLAKSIPMVQAIQAQCYQPIDRSQSLADDASQLVAEKCGVLAKPILGDFFEPLSVTKKNALVALLGGTIGNLETHTTNDSLSARLVKIFSNYRSMTSMSSYFLVSFDANTNATEIVDCYNNPELGSLITDCVNQVIDVSHFKYHVSWTPENHQLAMGILSTRDQMVALNDESFAIEEGQFLPVLNSYRYPVPFILRVAEQSGWNPIKTWSATGRVHYALFSSGN